MSEETDLSHLKWTIRPMRHEDIDRCLDIWSQVELTEAYQTVASVLSADPNGFYVAELEDTGEVVGMCSGAYTRVDTAFMGFYAVDPKYQRVGIGRELWSKTLSRLDSSTNIGLYGVPSMSEKYKKSGFTIEDTIRMLIYESEPHGEHLLRTDLLKDVDDLIGCRLVQVGDGSDESMFRKVIDYDQSVQRFNREKLLRLYLRGNDVPLTLAVIKDHSRSKLACDQHPIVTQGHIGERKMSCCARPSEVSIIEDEALSTNIKSSLSVSASNLGELPLRSSSPIDIPSIVSSTTIAHNQEQKSIESAGGYEILGYGCIRHDNKSGGMIGPIYADSSDVCEVLLRNLMDRFDLKPGAIYSVMALSSNKQASKILTKVGFNEMEQCSRMFTKFIPAASFSKIYFVHSPNFTLF